MGDQDRVAAFLESLQQLPPYVGVTLRGCPAGASFAKVGQTTVTSGVVATARNLEVRWYVGFVERGTEEILARYDSEGEAVSAVKELLDASHRPSDGSR